LAKNVINKLMKSDWRRENDKPPLKLNFLNPSLSSSLVKVGLLLLLLLLLPWLSKR